MTKYTIFKEGQEKPLVTLWPRKAVEITIPGMANLMHYDMVMLRKFWPRLITHQDILGVQWVKVPFNWPSGLDTYFVHRHQHATSTYASTFSGNPLSEEVVKWLKGELGGNDVAEWSEEDYTKEIEWLTKLYDEEENDD